MISQVKQYLANRCIYICTTVKGIVQHFVKYAHLLTHDIFVSASYLTNQHDSGMDTLFNSAIKQLHMFSKMSNYSS